MRERPILMTSENAQKCYEGTKMQTRRIVKPRNGSTADYAGVDYPCPYGVAGDRLWVRENGWERPARTSKMLRDGADTWERFYFDALLDSGEAEELKGYGFKRRPSIHMPRWACRTVLEITDVRVERLQEINLEDCQSEGVRCESYTGPPYCTWCSGHEAPCHRDAYKTLWESINGVGSWALNPWVWVITFQKVGRCGR